MKRSQKRPDRNTRDGRGMVTIAFIPHRTGVSRSIRVHKLLICFLVFLFVSVLGVSVFLYVDNRSLRLEASQLQSLKQARDDQKRQIVDLQKQIEELKAKMVKLWETDIMLRTIADMELPEEPISIAQSNAEFGETQESGGKISEVEISGDSTSERGKNENRGGSLTDQDGRGGGSISPSSNIPSIKPVDGSVVKSYDQSGQFKGVLFAAHEGTPVLATGNGEVEIAARGHKYGYQVLIDHGNGYKSFYGHLSDLGISSKSSVKRGDAIGKVGGTGSLAEGIALFYQVILNKEPVNPEDYFPVD